MAIYKEDFDNERKDRISAIARCNEYQKQLQVKEAELVKVKSRENELAAQLKMVKEKLNVMEEIMKKEKGKLATELHETKEEIAVKVAQVKQYQKQVEAYKQQVGLYKWLVLFHCQPVKYLSSGKLSGIIHLPCCVNLN